MVSGATSSCYSDLFLIIFFSHCAYTSVLFHMITRAAPTRCCSGFSRFILLNMLFTRQVFNMLGVHTMHAGGHLPSTMALAQFLFSLRLDSQATRQLITRTSTAIKRTDRGPIG